MVSVVLKVYDFLRMHRAMRLFSFLVTTALLVALVLTLQYKEDISDFLPLSSTHQSGLKVYQDISGANKIFVIFQAKKGQKTDADAMVSAIERFTTNLQAADTAGIARQLTAQVDMEKMQQVMDFVYRYMPLFLTPHDYQRMDSLLRDPGFAARQLQEDKRMLMFPTGNMLTSNIQRDPLGLFTPVVAKLQQRHLSLNYELYDGYIFSPDMKRAIVMVESPFGSSETEHNTQLINLLKAEAAKVTQSQPALEVHLTGGPVIAVGNATQIKTDSLLSVTLAILLITMLLFLTFRRLKNLLLIVLAVAWGWLFAMGGLALVHDHVSVIVIGISSVILGIAINYPLHFISHLSHTSTVRSALKEITVPLLVGNVTTVGAFLALVPLQSVALRDLGLFSSFLLVGTILLVLIYLPHVVKPVKAKPWGRFARFTDISLERKQGVVWAIVLLTGVLGYFSLQTKFDADMSHINYMTEEQKADMRYFQTLLQRDTTTEKVYVVAHGMTMDEALQHNQLLQPALEQVQHHVKGSTLSTCAPFLASNAEQVRRLKQWAAFRQQHKNLPDVLRREGMKAGFAPDSFYDFEVMFNGKFMPLSPASFAPLTTTAFQGNLSHDSIAGTFSIVNVLDVAPQKVAKIEKQFTGDTCYSFDVKSMNSALANNLSNNFNYIGWACALIVFFFLWFSFGSIELALLSFLPMAVSWVWILGIMSLLNIQFNIVNVILATFIFGQGDDYTIFITEGVSYEYAYRRKLLAAYKQSIIISALIMFIGIGSLILAKHPALHSLAEVTIVGMFAVVLMAYILPPLLYSGLVGTKSHYRRRPYSLKPFLVMALSATVFFAQLVYIYALGFRLFVLTKPTARKRKRFQKRVHRLFRYDLQHIPTVAWHEDPALAKVLKEPAVVVCNHQSMLDAAIVMALSPRLLIVANEHASLNPVIRKVFDWFGHIRLIDSQMLNLKQLKQSLSAGYSIVFFPEGERNDHSSILRFHKGAFHVAEALQVDVVPLLLHGVNEVLPRNSWCAFAGKITVCAGQRIMATDAAWGEDYAMRTKRVRQYYVDWYREVAGQIETAAYYRQLTLDKYRFKGVEVVREVKRNLTKFANYAAWVDTPCTAQRVVVLNSGWGEFALLFALTHRHTEVIAIEADADKTQLARYVADGLSLKWQAVETLPNDSLMDTPIFLLHPSPEQRATFNGYKVTIVE